MSIVDSAKELARLVQEVGKIDLYKQAVDLMGQVTEQAAKNFELTQRITELEHQLDIKGRVTFDTGSHTYQLDGKDIYCVHCYDKEKVLQRLHVEHIVQNPINPSLWSFTAACHRCHWRHRRISFIQKSILETGLLIPQPSSINSSRTPLDSCHTMMTNRDPVRFSQEGFRMIIPEIVAIGSLIKTVKEGIAGLAASASKLKNRELDREVSALTSKIAEVDVQMMHLSQKANDLQAESESLKTKLKQRGEYEFDDDRNFYQLKTPHGSNGWIYSGAYCPRCMDEKDKPIRMLKNEGLDYFECPSCKTKNKPPTRPKVKLSTLSQMRSESGPRDDHDPAMG